MVVIERILYMDKYPKNCHLLGSVSPIVAQNQLIRPVSLMGLAYKPLFYPHKQIKRKAKSLSIGLKKLKKKKKQTKKLW